jgi:nitronate monooxygenase
VASADSARIAATDSLMGWPALLDRSARATLRIFTGASAADCSTTPPKRAPIVIATSFTKRVGATVPIQLASMPGICTPELVAAVADAGGLGMLGAPLLSAAVLQSALEGLADRTRGAVGVNFLIPFLDPECVDVAARHARVVEFFYGDPDADLVRRGRAHGALVSWQVGSLAEALAAERAGCDFVVVQGTEAGGHVRGRTSLLPLLVWVLDEVRVPVVAAGGIANPRSLAAVLACGCGAARMGTRFVAARESGAHPAYVRALLGASADDTCLTEAFSVMWPDAPHRVLRSCVARAEELTDDVVGAIRLADRSLAIPRLSVVAPTRETTGHIEAMALYAGESVTDVTSVQPAAAIVAELVGEAERLLRVAAG